MKTKPKKSKTKPAEPRHQLFKVRNSLNSARLALADALLCSAEYKELDKLLATAKASLDNFLNASPAVPSSLVHTAKTAAPADWCNCKTVHSWYGEGHASQCPCAGQRIESAAPPPARFYLCFDNETTEFYTPIGFAWTEEGLNDLHIQFDGPGTSNYAPRMDRDGKFLVVDEMSVLHQIKSIGLIATPPAGAKLLAPQLLKYFWNEL